MCFYRFYFGAVAQAVQFTSNAVLQAGLDVF